MAKSLIFSSLTTYTFFSSFHLMFSDLWDPSPYVSENVFQYYISFVDDFSCFIRLLPLQTKSQTLDTFVTFNAQVELQFNTKIKQLQTEWGGEFQTFSTYLNSCGINHHVTYPHIHTQNGIVERKHCHIVDTSLALLDTLPFLSNFGHMPLNTLSISSISYPLLLSTISTLTFSFIITILTTPL